MFKNLFKNSDDRTVDVAERRIGVIGKTLSSITSKDIQEDIDKTFAEVLKEFELSESKETTIESLHKQLDEFKALNKNIYNKISTMKSVGLINTPSSTRKLKELQAEENKVTMKIQELRQQIEKSDKIKELTEVYMSKFPGYKFVDRDTMFSIMKKYTLVMGEAFTYTREIPEKSVEIIGNFQSQIEESKEIVTITREDSSWRDTPRYELGIRAKRKYEDDRFNDGIHYWSSREYTISAFKMVAPENHFSIPVISVEATRYNDAYEAPIMKLNDNNQLTFDVRDLQAAARNAQKEVLDPIATLEVEGGYIIMDAWDKEAEIPEIKNPLLN